MLRSISKALLALTLLAGPAAAQSLALSELDLENSGDCRQLAARDRTSGAMIPLGCLDTAKHGWTLMLNAVELQGLGSIGPRPNGTLGISFPGSGAFWTTFNSAMAGKYGVPTPSKIGAHVNRINDRLLVGAATASSGDFPATTKDWYEALESGKTHPLGFRTSWAQTASIATNGGIGVLGAARTSDSNIPTFQLAMGGLFASNNDNTTAQQLATALYSVAFRQPGAGAGPGAGTVGAEFDVANLGNAVQITPANLYPTTGFTTALQVNSGAVVPGAQTASAAITIGNNGANFNAGIVVADKAINGLTFDSSGKVKGGGGSAMRLPVFSQLEWWSTQGSSPSSVVSSEILTPANGQSIRFRDTGTFIGNATGSVSNLLVSFIGAAQNASAVIKPGASGSSTDFTASPFTGSDAPVGLRSRGASAVILGNDSANFASATSAGLISAVGLGVTGGRSGPGKIVARSDLGLTIQGVKGTAAELNIVNSAGAAVANVPTGTVDVVFGGAVRLTPVTVDSLPACAAGTKGAIMAVSDAASASYNAAVVGGGSISLPVYCNGTAWTMH